MSLDVSICAVDSIRRKRLRHILAMWVLIFNPDDSILQEDSTFFQEGLIFVNHKLNVSKFVVTTCPFEIMDIIHIQGNNPTRDSYSGALLHHRFNILQVLFKAVSLFIFHSHKVRRAGENASHGFIRKI